MSHREKIKRVLSPLRMIRTAMQSRRAFSNWLSAGLTYYVNKLGFTHSEHVVVKCYDGIVDVLPLNTYGSILHAISNGVVAGYLCREHAVILEDRTLVPIAEFLAGSALPEALALGWRYNILNRCWHKNDFRFRHMHFPILEVFELGNYEGIEVSGRMVLDVGAFVGETAIYFASKGAKLIVAIEPLLENYDEMLKNIELNKLGQKIVPVNAAVGSRPGAVMTARNVKPELRGGVLPQGGYKIPVFTLGQLYEDYIRDETNNVLKMDCEGCEYDIILNSYEHVKKFEEIVFEYHAYITGIPLEALLEKLGRDYVCEAINEEFYRRCFRKIYSRRELGLLRCVKRQ